LEKDLVGEERVGMEREWELNEVIHEKIKYRESRELYQEEEEI